MIELPELPELPEPVHAEMVAYGRTWRLTVQRVPQDGGVDDVPRAIEYVTVAADGVPFATHMRLVTDGT